MAQPEYTFDLTIDVPSKTMTYVCRACHQQEHGGSVPNPGLYSRMKAHLREQHRVDAEGWKIKHQETGPTEAVVSFCSSESL